MLQRGCDIAEVTELPLPPKGRLWACCIVLKGEEKDSSRMSCAPNIRSTSRHPGDVIEEIAEDRPKTSTITYLPPCDEWQRSLCQKLGMTFIRRNNTHILQPKEYSISHQPAATVRIQGDGNCFFKALAFVITGSQDEHLELRGIATSYMQHNAEILSCYLNAHENNGRVSSKNKHAQFICLGYGS